jgi:hypothetical protein
VCSWWHCDSAARSASVMLLSRRESSGSPTNSRLRSWWQAIAGPAVIGGIAGRRCDHSVTRGGRRMRSSAQAASAATTLGGSGIEQRRWGPATDGSSPRPLGSLQVAVHSYLSPSSGRAVAPPCWMRRQLEVADPALVRSEALGVGMAWPRVVRILATGTDRPCEWPDRQASENRWAASKPSHNGCRADRAGRGGAYRALGDLCHAAGG